MWGKSHSWRTFWWNRNLKFVNFSSQLEIGLSSVGKIYLVYGILENIKTCLYGNNVADLKQIQSLSRDEKTIEHWISIQVFHSVIKWYTGSHEKGFWKSWFGRFSEIMVKINEEYLRKLILFSALKFEYNFRALPACYNNCLWLSVN